MNLLEAQSLVLFVVFLVLLVVKFVALIDGAMRPAQAYLAADKMTKTGWMWILGIAFAADLLIQSFLIQMAGTVAAFVYLLDVRPALMEVTRRR